MESIVNFLSQQNGLFLYILIFSFLIIGSIGFPGPEELILIFSGYAVYHKLANPIFITVVCLLGIIGSDGLIYYYGKMFSSGVLRRPPPKSMVPRKALTRSERYLEKYGVWMVIPARFISWLRHAVFFASGVYHLNLTTLLLLDFLAGIVFTPLIIFIGYKFAPTVDSLTQITGKARHLGVLIVLVIIIPTFVVLFRYLPRKNKNGSFIAPPDHR